MVDLTGLEVSVFRNERMMGVRRWRSAVVALSILGGLAATAPGQSPQAAPGYAQAEYAFNSLDLRSRIDLQIDLIAAGYLNAVPIESFAPRVFESIARFQKERGLAPNGIADRTVISRLSAETSGLYRMWQFKLVPNPVRGRPIWMPTGMGLIPKEQPHQIAFQAADDKITVSYRHLKRDLGQTYEELVRGYRLGGVKINFTVTRPDWFVLSTTNKDGKDGYLRYHVDGDGMTGFALFWDNAKGNVHGERIAVLMSASLGSRFLGSPFLNPPNLEQPQVASTPPAPAPVQPPRPEPPPSSPKGISSGTGFFVGPDGLVVTNEHVVQDCASIQVRSDERKLSQAILLAKDKTNDLALLSTHFRPARVASVRPIARLGEGVAAFDFPHSDVLATAGNFTLGNITATAGLEDDTRFFQISAPVQSGNSGGPLLDFKGNVVGVVTSKLNALRFALRGGDLPQNVNFAVKASLLAAFLDANSVTINRQDADSPRLDTADLADVARGISVFVACVR